MHDVARQPVAGFAAQNDARHVAAQEERRPLRHRIRADVHKRQHVALLKGMQLRLADEHIRRRAQAAAQRPRLHIALACGRLPDDRHAHAHVAAEIVDVVNTAVHNGVGRSAVHLGIDHAGQVRATFGGEEAPHFNRQFAMRSQRGQIGRQFANRRERVAVILVAKIREIQAGAVFHADGFHAVFRFQPVGQRAEHGKLLALPIQLLALGAGKIVDALDANTGGGGAMVERGEEIPLVHAELRTRRQPQQHGVNPAARPRGLVDQANVQRGFAGEARHAQIHGALHVRHRLVHAGKEHHVGGNALLTADFQLAGAAYLERADQTAHRRNEKRVRLDGIAEADIFGHDGAHGLHAARELHLVKDEARRAEALCDGKEVIHVEPPFWRPLRRRTAPAARRGRSCRFC